MTVLRRLAPDPGEVELEALLDGLRAAPPLEPFGDLVLEACDAVARALFRDPAVRAHPDLVVLASWLRRANTARLATDARSLGIRVPRGLVFHIPPANVDTIAMYSLALSILAGNRNIVRLSSRAGVGAARICAALDEGLSDPELAPIRAGTAVLTWERELSAAAVCSAACDVRLVWGGDDTVQALRSLPLSAGAKDVAFIDRFSLAAISSGAWIATGEPAREELARRLCNDAYWFDQQGCSSPRLVVWCGDAEQAAAASEDLFTRLAGQLAARGYELPLGAVTAKLAWIAGAAIDRPLTRVRDHGNELAVLTLSTLTNLDREHCGAGTFLEVALPALADLAQHVSPRDQTLAVYGFPQAELEQFVRNAGGRGVDRIVPLGEALSFDHRWDGMDLLSELTRQVTISPAAGYLALGSLAA
jgi:hypothetical protein